MSRNDEVDRTWPGPLCMSTRKTIRSDVACGPLHDATMRSRRLTQAIAGSNDEVGRSADPPSKLRTWTEDFNELSETPLKVDVSRRGARRTGLMIVCSHVI